MTSVQAGLEIGALFGFALEFRGPSEVGGRRPAYVAWPTPLTIVMIAFTSPGLTARVSSARNEWGSPGLSITNAPASRARSTPAAVSHGLLDSMIAASGRPRCCSLKVCRSRSWPSTWATRTPASPSGRTRTSCRPVSSGRGWRSTGCSAWGRADGLEAA